MKEKYVYWVNYTYQTNYGFGYGACDLSLDHPIRSVLDVKLIIELINNPDFTKQMDAIKVVLSGWKLICKESYKTDEIPS